jgi:hypothetical protein
VERGELKARAQELRAAGRTPQQIARALGVPRATVTSLVRGVAVKRPDAPAMPLIGCWVTRQWSNGLIIEDRPADWVDDRELPPFAMGAGLASVVVARAADNGASVCGYLVDTYCLGVKNAVPPSMVDQRGLPAFVADFFSVYAGVPLPAPIELVQNLVFGAVDHARGLGFEPHRDFRAAASHLDTWQGPGRITFGLNGRPYFQQGPYDNAERITRTLDKSVGPGNYGFTADLA